MQDEKQFLIGEGLANTILNYLANQPWRAVDGMVHGLQALKPLESPPSEETDDKGRE